MKPNLRNLAAQAVFIITLMSNLGCGAGGPRTYPVQGKVELAGADVKLLAGSHVEFALAADPRVRASGEIQEDGSFKLQSNHAGGILDGTREGGRSRDRVRELASHCCQSGEMGGPRTGGGVGWTSGGVRKRIWIG